MCQEGECHTRIGEDSYSLADMHELPIVQSLRSKAEAGDKAAALELAEDDELFKPHLQPEELQRENRAKMRRVDPTVNLAADGFDRWSEGMTARDSSKVCTEPLVGLLLEERGVDGVPQLGGLWHKLTSCPGTMCGTSQIVLVHVWPALLWRILVMKTSLSVVMQSRYTV